MKTNIYSLLCFLIMLSSCGGPEFSDCNGLLSACTGSQDGAYCTFGYKWGDNPSFSPNGVNATGPETPGGTITYSFHTQITTVSTHQKDDMETVSFDEKGACARESAESALMEWEKYGNFSFLKETDNSESNIQFIAAKEVNNNTGGPNYQDELCGAIRGKIVMKDSKIADCHNFYILCLHEIGHVLGLGHVSSPNVMKQGQEKYSYTGLQEGDIEGIIAIYGDK